ALRNAPTVADMVAIVDAVIRDLSRRSAAPPFWFTQLTDDWLTDEANPAVDTLIERSGLSARHVERLAGRIYGAPPKLLARKYRALRAASLIGACDGAPDERMDDVFYDQSHAIREFKRFVGFTPGQLRRDPPPVMRLTRQRRALAGLVPTIAAVS
ncbi:MAG TPA: AraC family transcriptional regulator, partial [Sphingomonadaceae bacterium]|nr:AraC family transcriptional regulator [Sphingomonadaceae bacterium]